MKKQYLLTLLIAISGLFTVNNASAQDIDWKGSTLADAITYCKNGGFVYLYNVDAGKFLTAGGDYGVQGVLGAVGMRMQLEQNTAGTFVRVRSRIDNGKQGDCMSINLTFSGTGQAIYLDRLESETTGTQISYPWWKFNVSTSGTYTNYTIQFTRNNRTSNVYAGSTNGSTVVTTASSETTWRIVTAKDYLTQMNNLTWGEIDMNAFIQDAEFTRDSTDAKYWVWSTDGEGNVNTDNIDGWNNAFTHWHQRNQDKMNNGIAIGFTGDDDTWRSNNAKYYSAEIYNEVNQLEQTAVVSDATSTTGLRPGVYKVTCQGLYYDDADGTTNNGVAYFFANKGSDDTEVKTLLLPMDVSGATGITPHSGVSAGQYMYNNPDNLINTIFIEVKAGDKLTLGFRQTANTGWSVFRNVRFYACGEMNLYVDEDFTHTGSFSYKDKNGVAHTDVGDPYDIYEMKTFKYDYPTTVYFQRTMTAGKWNTLCVPFDMTGAQVREVFGENTLVSKLKGIDESGSTILFEKYANLFTDGIKQAVPYIIKPEKAPVTKTLDIKIGNDQRAVVITNSPIYVINGIIKSQVYLIDPQTIDSKNDYNSTNYSSVGSITMAGSYYQSTASTNEYIISKGNMYCLTSDTKTSWPLYASYCKLVYSAPAGSSAKKFDIGIDDGGVVTKIDKIEGLDTEGFTNSGNQYKNMVYNLNGQKVSSGSIDSLPKGIYIKNGKKFIVK